MLWVPSAAALLAYAAAVLLGERRTEPAAADARDGAAPRRALIAGWIAHALAIVVDMAGIGSPISGARFGFAPALSATLWLVIAVYAVESRWVPLPGVRRWLGLLGAAAVVLAAIFPGEFRPQAVSAWAPLHWALGIASYGLFGAAVLHAVMLDTAERRMRSNLRAASRTGMPLLQLERLTFQFVAAGFALLSATLLLGWRGRHAIRWLYAGALLLLLAYVGSRFVFEVVLHRTAT